MMSAWIEMIEDKDADGRLKELLDKARSPHGTVDTGAFIATRNHERTCDALPGGAAQR